MFNNLRTPKGFLTLVVVALLMAACSTPKYYVFKTIKHTPVVKNEVTQEEKTNAEDTFPADLSEEKGDETAVASVEKTAEPLNLNKIAQAMAEKAKAQPVKQEKISRLDKIRTAVQIKKELKKIEKQKDVTQDSPGMDKPKSQLVALLLVFFVGALGIHRFYLGYTTIGIIQLLTLGGCGVWALIDFIRIIIGDLKPADGSDYDPEL